MKALIGVILLCPFVSLANSFTVTWVLSPNFGTIYSWQTSWQWGLVHLGLEVSVFGEAWIAQSPTLGIPLLYGVVSDLRLQYSLEIAWQGWSLTWQHICYYKLQQSRWWDGIGIEMLQLRWEY